MGRLMEVVQKTLRGGVLFFSCKARLVRNDTPLVESL